MPSPSGTQGRYPYQNEPIWSRSEKAIAHRVFDAALNREPPENMQEAKQKANQIREHAGLRNLEHCLTERREEIARKYDCRDSGTHARIWQTLVRTQRKSYAVCVETN